MRSDKAFGGSEMSSVAEASTLVKRIAEPRPVGDKVKAAIDRASRRSGLSFMRTREIWYRNARRIDSTEMDRLREEAARREAEASVESVLALRDRLIASDADFHRPAIAALDAALSAMGCPVRTMVCPLGSVDLPEE